MCGTRRPLWSVEALPLACCLGVFDTVLPLLICSAWSHVADYYAPRKVLAFNCQADLRIMRVGFTVGVACYNTIVSVSIRSRQYRGQSSVRTLTLRRQSSLCQV
jgi:hypothetical protein